MDYDVRPEPSPAERAALIVALEQLLAREGGTDAPRAYRSKWWQAGLRESVLSEPERGDRELRELPARGSDRG